MLNTSYRYTASATFIYDDKEDPVIIPSESILAIITNYDYDNNNMPIIYMSFNVNSTLYDLMVEYAETAKIILSLKKYDNKAASAVQRVYIQEEFSYLIQTDADYHKPLNKLETARDKSNDSYKRGTIALLCTKSIDKNRGLFNDIIKNSNMISVVNKYTTNMTMIIEPFINNEIIPVLIIPPMSSITDLLSFLNKNQVFYERGYRYFRDFSKTYLLSNEGNPVDDGDADYDTIIINIVNTTSIESKSVGIDVDREQKAYVMNVDALDTHLAFNLVQEKDYNHIIGLDDNGATKKLSLSVLNEQSIEKVKIERVRDINTTDIIKHTVDSVSVVLEIQRTELDGTLFTPNKEYIVRNYQEFQEYNGRFILSAKKEIMIQQDNEFISNTLLTFRKVME